MHCLPKWQAFWVANCWCLVASGAPSDCTRPPVWVEWAQGWVQEGPTGCKSFEFCIVHVLCKGLLVCHESQYCPWLPELHSLSLATHWQRAKPKKAHHPPQSKIHSWPGSHPPVVQKASLPYLGILLGHMQHLILYQGLVDTPYMPTKSQWIALLPIITLFHFLRGCYIECPIVGIVAKTLTFHCLVKNKTLVVAIINTCLLAKPLPTHYCWLLSYWCDTILIR